MSCRLCGSENRSVVNILTFRHGKYKNIIEGVLSIQVEDSSYESQMCSVCYQELANFLKWRTECVKYNREYLIRKTINDNDESLQEDLCAAIEEPEAKPRATICSEKPVLVIKPANQHINRPTSEEPALAIEPVESVAALERIEQHAIVPAPNSLNNACAICHEKFSDKKTLERHRCRKHLQMRYAAEKSVKVLLPRLNVSMDDYRSALGIFVESTQIRVEFRDRMKFYSLQPEPKRRHFNEVKGIEKNKRQKRSDRSQPKMEVERQRKRPSELDQLNKKDVTNKPSNPEFQAENPTKAKRRKIFNYKEVRQQHRQEVEKKYKKSLEILSEREKKLQLINSRYNPAVELKKIFENYTSNVGSKLSLLWSAMDVHPHIQYSNIENLVKNHGPIQCTLLDSNDRTFYFGNRGETTNVVKKPDVSMTKRRDTDWSQLPLDATLSPPVVDLTDSHPTSTSSDKRPAYVFKIINQTKPLPSQPMKNYSPNQKRALSANKPDSSSPMSQRIAVSQKPLRGTIVDATETQPKQRRERRKTMGMEGSIVSIYGQPPLTSRTIDEHESTARPERINRPRAEWPSEARENFFQKTYSRVEPTRSNNVPDHNCATHNITVLQNICPSQSILPKSIFPPQNNHQPNIQQNNFVGVASIGQENNHIIQPSTAVPQQNMNQSIQSNTLTARQNPHVKNNAEQNSRANNNYGIHPNIAVMPQSELPVNRPTYNIKRRRQTVQAPVYSQMESEFISTNLLDCSDIAPNMGFYSSAALNYSHDISARVVDPLFRESPQGQRDTRANRKLNVLTVNEINTKEMFSGSRK